ncbi:hypothetical protein [Specibacter sp. RAF43]|uniref:hypothetical protein n=1 Tax=Specibacter sp. RAF43 TaxID=3233057 RepID=UPI003F95CD5F
MEQLSPEHDNLHTPTTDDIFWTETAWFAFAVPERNLTAFVYPVFRTNQNICSSAVYIWDHQGETDHTILYSQNYWHIPMPNDLTRMRLESGLKYDVIEPLRKYRVRYDSEEVQFDLEFTGLVEPIFTPRGDHLDQPGHIVGTLNLYGEEIAVDCFEIRDKSWHVRSDKSLILPDDVAEGSYAYGINANTAFLARTMSEDKDFGRLRRGGWLLRDGISSPIVSGTRTAERTGADRPSNHIVIEGVDDLGRTFTAVGDTVNNFALRSTPAMVPWISGTNWSIDGEWAWGENQEWSLGARHRMKKKLEAGVASE